jgi:hypothetical protein
MEPIDKNMMIQTCVHRYMKTTSTTLKEEILYNLLSLPIPFYGEMGLDNQIDFNSQTL